MSQKFTDAARGQLTATLTNSATTFDIVSGGSLFPVANTGSASISATTDWFKAVIQDNSNGNFEIVYVRTHTSGSNTFANVLRGQEGTTALAFSADSVFGLRPLAADMDQAINSRVTKTGVNGSAALPTGTTAQRDSSPANGYLRYNSDNNEFEGRVNGAWSSIGSASMIEALVEITATAGQTSFTASYNPGAVVVLRNGVRLATSDITTTSGTAIVLSTPAATNDIISIVSYKLAAIANAVAKSGDTMTGPLVVPAGASGSQVPRASEVGLLAGANSWAANQTVPSLNGGQLAGMRNKIQNGKMDIARRGASFPALASGANFVDRWGFGNTTTGVLTGAQQLDSPAVEFQNSLRLTVTTADAAIAASDVCWVQHRIEGYNVRDLISRTCTMSFWVRSSKTGVHCAAFKNSISDRCYVAEYTVLVANAWEYKTITIVGGLVSTGTWDWTTGIGLRVDFALCCGSTFQTTPGSWATSDFYGTANQVNCLDTVGNIFAITGVQLEAGTVATPFEHRGYDVELAMCQRYLPVFSGLGYYGTGLSSSGTLGYAVLPLTVEPRVPPTGVIQGAGSVFIAINASASTVSITGLAINSTSYSTVAVSVTAASGLTPNAPLLFGGNSSGTKLIFTGAEL